jgi:hypothetical protein
VLPHQPHFGLPSATPGMAIKTEPEVSKMVPGWPRTTWISFLGTFHPTRRNLLHALTALRQLIYYRSPRSLNPLGSPQHSRPHGDDKSYMPLNRMPQVPKKSQGENNATDLFATYSQLHPGLGLPIPQSLQSAGTASDFKGFHPVLGKVSV